MVTITEQVATDSMITSATLKVNGARNAAHALDKALTHLERTGWAVSIESYESRKDHETGEYTITVY